jgi:hypothetical protein
MVDIDDYLRRNVVDALILTISTVQITCDDVYCDELALPRFKTKNMSISSQSDSPHWAPIKSLRETVSAALKS